MPILSISVETFNQVSLCQLNWIEISGLVFTSFNFNTFSFLKRDGSLFFVSSKNGEKSKLVLIHVPLVSWSNYFHQNNFRFEQQHGFFLFYLFGVVRCGVYHISIWIETMNAIRLKSHLLLTSGRMKIVTQIKMREQREMFWWRERVRFTYSILVCYYFCHIHQADATFNCINFRLIVSSYFIRFTFGGKKRFFLLVLLLFSTLMILQWAKPVDIDAWLDLMYFNWN